MDSPGACASCGKHLPLGDTRETASELSAVRRQLACNGTRTIAQIRYSIPLRRRFPGDRPAWRRRRGPSVARKLAIMGQTLAARLQFDRARGTTPNCKRTANDHAADLDDRPAFPATPCAAGRLGTVDRRVPDSAIAGNGRAEFLAFPGDYILAFYAMLEREPSFALIGFIREDFAGFGRRRLRPDQRHRRRLCRRIASAGLSLCNSIACAYAEKSPVVVVSGSPGLPRAVQQSPAAPRGEGLQHPGRGLPPPLRRPRRARRSGRPPLAEIDRVLAAVPPLSPPGIHRVAAGPPSRPSPQVALQARCQRAAERQGKSSREAVAEAERSPLPPPAGRSSLPASRFTASGCKTGCWPWPKGPASPWPRRCSTRASSASGTAPTWGISRGRHGPRGGLAIRRRKRLRVDPRRLYDRHQPRRGFDPGRCIYATSELLRISHHHYDNVQMADFIEGLITARLRAPQWALPPPFAAGPSAFQLRPGEQITISRLIRG